MRKEKERNKRKKLCNYVFEIRNEESVLCLVGHKLRHMRGAVMQVRDVTAEDASRFCVCFDSFHVHITRSRRP
jgi:hypothetical protein